MSSVGFPSVVPRMFCLILSLFCLLNDKEGSCTPPISLGIGPAEYSRVGIGLVCVRGKQRDCGLGGSPQGLSFMYAVIFLGSCLGQPLDSVR